MKLTDFERLSDLGLVTVVSLFVPIEAIDRDPKDAPRVFFLFKKTPELARLIEAYWSGQLTIEPQQLLSQVKKIKARIHGDK